MTVKEFWKKVEKVYEELKSEHEYLGIRFEEKMRHIGEICDNSRDNPDRQDERDFPEYDSEEYHNLPELDGTSAWHLNDYLLYNRLGPFAVPAYMADKNVANYFLPSHCYIIAGDSASAGPDDDEIVIRDAVVVAILY